MSDKLNTVSGPDLALNKRRSSAEVDKERAESYLSSLPLAEKVALVKSLKAQIDAEVKSLTEAAATATGLTKEL